MSLSNILLRIALPAVALVLPAAAMQSTATCTAPLVDASYFSPPTPVTPLVHTDGTWFRGADGRYMILRGFNATGTAKVPPFEGLTSQKLVDPMAVWGANVVRFLFTWEAFEPTPGCYNPGYLTYYQQAVQYAANDNINVMVDFHEDALSRNALNGCGEGFPLWTLTTEIKPVAPNNTKASCSGYGVTLTFSQNALAFTRFFANGADTNYARSRFIQMAGIVSSTLSQYPNVIGYDMLNESWTTAPELDAFYQEVGPVISKGHPGAMLMFEPELNFLDQLLGPALSAVNTAAAPPANLPNMVYAPHHYDPLGEALGIWFGDDPNVAIKQFQASSNKWNVPMILGEFGTYSTVLGASGLMEAFYAGLDCDLLSGTQWDYDPGWTPTNLDGWNGEDYSINDNHLNLRPETFVPRPYPQATAGVPTAFSRSASGFQYAWTNDPSLGGGVTQFYMPSGYSTAKSAVKFTPASARVTCTWQGATALTCQSSYQGAIKLTFVK